MKAPHIQHGFTLLELMTVIMIAAILLAVGVPSFNSIMRSNQIAAESNNLMSALNLARSEAMTRGLRVSVCAADGDACNEDPEWNNGWLVFSDDFGTPGVIDVGDELIQSFGAPAPGVTIETDDVSVTFNRTAFAVAEAEFDLEKAGCGDQQARHIEVAPTGRVSLSKQDCT